MKNYDELIDFVENVLGIELLLYQKIMLKIICEKDEKYIIEKNFCKIIKNFE